MQKITTKNLTIIAMVILLIATISCSATFALFSSKKTITGTITFDANLTMEMDNYTTKNGLTVKGGIDNSSGNTNWKISLTNEAFVYSAGFFILTDAVKTAMAGVNVSLKSNISNSIQLSAKITVSHKDVIIIDSKNRIINNKSTSNNELVWKTEAVKAKDGITKKLSEIISNIKLNIVDINATAFQIEFNGNFI